MQQQTSQFQSIRKRLISGGIWAFLGKIASALTNLLISGLLARLLAPDDIGVYFLIFSLAMAGSTAGQMGLNQVAVRFTSEAIAKENSNQVRSLIARIFLIALFSTLSLALLFNYGAGEWIATYLFHAPAMLNIIGVASLWIVTLAFQSLLAESFRGLHDIQLATVFQTLASNIILLIFLIFFLLTSKELTLRDILIFTILSGGISILLGGFLLHKHLWRLPAVPASSYPIALILRTAWPFLITSITIFILSQTCLWILGIFREPDEVALYGAAARIINLVAMPLMIANAVLPPIISELSTKNQKPKLQRILRITATLTGLPALAVIMCFIIFGEFTLAIVFGEYYKNATNILLILSIGQIVNIWAGSCGLTLMMTGHEKTMMYITLFAGFLTITMSLLIVDTYGSTGIAVVTATVLVVQNALMLTFAKIKVGVWTHAIFSINTLKETFKGQKS